MPLTIEATPVWLRFVVRGDQRVLQYLTTLIDMDESNIVGQRQEWRDVPTEVEAPQDDREGKR